MAPTGADPVTSRFSVDAEAISLNHMMLTSLYFHSFCLSRDHSGLSEVTRHVVKVSSLTRFRGSRAANSHSFQAITSVATRSACDAALLVSAIALLLCFGPAGRNEDVVDDGIDVGSVHWFVHDHRPVGAECRQHEGEHLEVLVFRNLAAIFGALK